VKGKFRKLMAAVAVVLVLALGGLSAMAALAQSEQAVSNQLTMTGSSSGALLTLSWTSVEGGVINGDAVSVTWYVDQTYSVNVTAKNNTTVTIAGVYGKLTGWDTGQFKLEWYTGVGGGQWIDLAADAAGPKNCGFFVNGTYYFGPKGGETYTAGHTEVFKFRTTPKTAVPNINIALVCVTGVTDPR